MATQCFSGKTSAVTGVASGIGAAITRLLAVDNDADAPANIANHVCDVTFATQAGAMITEAIARFGLLDLLFNNAGSGVLEETPDIDDETRNRVFTMYGHDRGSAHTRRDTRAFLYIVC